MNNQNKGQNQKLRRKACVFAVLMILTQAIFSLFYSFTSSVQHTALNISAVINVIGLAILVTAGFGLMISYLKRLVWSGLGFTLFITAFTVQLYPLVNQLWTKAHIHYATTGFNQMSFSLHLANSNLPSDQLYGNCISNALKCALAMVVAFSSILGRVGPLECYIVTVIGTFGFQLNRQLISNLSTDGFGTYYIFTFGGFMGLALGSIMKLCKEKVDRGSSTSRNKFNQASAFSSSIAFFGSLIIFIFFPMLSYEVEISKKFNTFYLYTGPTSLILGMSSSVLGAFCISSLINGHTIVRDILHAPIAGGIITGSASFFIVSPVYSLVVGFSGGAIQAFIQNIIEKRWLKKKPVISTISWSLFGVQGIIGGIFSTGYKRIIESQCKNFTFGSETIAYAAQSQLIIAAISAGIGFFCGVIAVLLILLTSKQKSKDHFLDKTYWTFDDGINFLQKKNEKPRILKSPQILQNKDKDKVQNLIKTQNVIKNDEKDSNQEFKGKNVIIQYSQIIPFEVSTPNFEMSFSQGQQPIQKHTYL